MIIGKNGAGKSSILDAISMLQSELDYNLNGNKRTHLTLDDININMMEADCEMTLQTENNKKFVWSFNRNKKMNSRPTVKYKITKNDFLLELNQEFRNFEKENTPIFLHFKSTDIPNAQDFIKWYKDLVLFESSLASGNKSINTH